MKANWPLRLCLGNHGEGNGMERRCKAGCGGEKQREREGQSEGGERETKGQKWRKTERERRAREKR